jgi:hypothetical protein
MHFFLIMDSILFIWKQINNLQNAKWLCGYHGENLTARGSILNRVLIRREIIVTPNSFYYHEDEVFLDRLWSQYLF